MIKVSQEQYENDFGDKEKKANALEHALDIRKFEIELYWKRATYFWTLIGATFAGYGAIQASSVQAPARTDLSIVLACLGGVLSFAWFCVNKGSKQWQENWENHVDMLEDAVIGPLYKTVLRRPRAKGFAPRLKQLLTGPAPYSVSKINQIISLFVSILWLILLCRALPPVSVAWPIDRESKTIMVAAVAACIAFLLLGRTHEGDYRHHASKRKTTIEPSGTSASPSPLPTIENTETGD